MIDNLSRTQPQEKHLTPVLRHLHWLHTCWSQRSQRGNLHASSAEMAFTRVTVCQLIVDVLQRFILLKPSWRPSYRFTPCLYSKLYKFKCELKYDWIAAPSCGFAPLAWLLWSEFWRYCPPFVFCEALIPGRMRKSSTKSPRAGW